MERLSRCLFRGNCWPPRPRLRTPGRRRTHPPCDRSYTVKGFGEVKPPRDPFSPSDVASRHIGREMRFLEERSPSKPPPARRFYHAQLNHGSLSTISALS